MASFVKRGSNWRVEVNYRGQRYTATFSSKVEAKEWANRKAIALKSFRSGHMGKWKTVGDAFDRYKKEVSPKKKGGRWEIIRLNKLKNYDLVDVRLEDLTTSDIAYWRDQRLKEVSTGSVRREMGLIGAVFTKCCMEWNWLHDNPIRLVKRPSDGKPRERRINEREIQVILDELGYVVGIKITNKKQLVGAYFLLAIETAMRLGEICDLSQKTIFLNDRYVLLEDTKNNSSRKVPLSKTAIVILNDIIASNLTIVSEVASNLFRTARDKINADETRIDLIDLTFHDTRHEAITRLAKKLDILDLAKMIGHRDLKSLMIYYNATPTEIAARLD